MVLCVLDLDCRKSLKIIMGWGIEWWTHGHPLLYYSKNKIADQNPSNQDLTQSYPIIWQTKLGILDSLENFSIQQDWKLWPMKIKDNLKTESAKFTHCFLWCCVLRKQWIWSEGAAYYLQFYILHQNPFFLCKIKYLHTPFYILGKP